MSAPKLLWDWGTAYDLFVSLHMLHRPAQYGIRGAWAAGVRSRLPAHARDLFQRTEMYIAAPYHWVYSLPAPKDGATALAALAQIPAAERLPTLTFAPNAPPPLVDTLRGVMARGKWTDADLEALAAILEAHKPPPSKKELIEGLALWSRAEEFGEQYLEGLQAYHEVFFAEEENRIRPALQAALDRAQALAKKLELPELLEELSQGLRFAELPKAAELVLAPSFWSTPLIVEAWVGVDRHLILFGARPADAALSAGEAVPDALFKALKALADPTRLRILRYLAKEPLTPAQLSRRLRLRAPTVVHHLYALRIAGLVHLTVGQGDERRYTIRREGVASTLDALMRFLEIDTRE